MVTTALVPVPRAGHDHPAGLKAPGYFPRRGGVAIHRYLEPAFVPAFLADAQALAAGTLPAAAHFAWQDQDRFAGVNATCLRHPITGTFYVVSVEAVCRFPGEPALDPRRIRSAGFVLRRVVDGAPQRWMVVKGEPVGWKSVDAAAAPLDPDHARRDGREPASPEPPYNGEQTYPLAPLLVRDADGRSRTILHGFLPVAGGSARVAAAPAPGGSVPAELRDGVRGALKTSRSWPLGTGDAHAWRASDGHLIDRGVPTPDTFRLLQDLVRRHGLGIRAGGDNAGLEQVLGEWKLVRRYVEARDTWGRETIAEDSRPFLEWLREQLAPLRAEEPGSSVLHELLGEKDPTTKALPGLQTGGDVKDWQLHVKEGQAAALRDALLVRDLALIDRTVGAAPRPRLTHADDERFVVVPFVRWAGARCTHVTWGQPSEAFRVASPYDPEAHRPVVVQLPGLKDVKRGLPGAHFLAPKDLAEKILGMKADGLDIEKGGFSLPDLCFSFSFSLPAITICAFILLYIMISILAVLFFWLPWVFLVLPSFCIGKIKASVEASP